MLKSLAFTTALVSAVVVALVLILFISVDGPVQTARAGPGDVTLVAIDTVIDDDGDQHEDGTQGLAGDDECTDDADNDGDTLTDSADPDCRTGLYLDNDDTAIGTIDDCYQIPAVGDTHTFDLIIQGVDAVDLIGGYQVDIDYDPNVIRMGIDDDGDTLFDEDPAGDFFDEDGDTVLDEDPLDFIDIDGPASINPDDVTILSRIGSGGGVGYLHLSDTQATLGSATVAAGDGTTSPPYPGMHESGDGVLARIAVTAVGAGVSPLFMPGPAGGADGTSDLVISDGDGGNSLAGDEIPVETVSVASISVGQACVQVTPPPTPTPTAPPTPAPTPTPGPPTATPTPADGATPTPAGTATPTPAGTATPTGTPATGAGAAPPTGDGIPLQEGGSSVLSWLLVGLGTALVLTATGYGTYWRSRRRLTH